MDSVKISKAKIDKFWKINDISNNDQLKCCSWYLLYVWRFNCDGFIFKLFIKFNYSTFQSVSKVT